MWAHSSSGWGGDSFENVLPWQLLPGWRSPGKVFRRELRAVRGIAASIAGRVDGQVSSQFGRTGLILAVVALTLGLFFTAQLQSAPIKAAVTPESRREIASATIKRLEQEQADLKKVIAEQRDALANQQKAVASDKTSLTDISREIERQKILAGMVPLKGRGVKVTLDDSATTKIPTTTIPACTSSTSTSCATCSTCSGSPAPRPSR